MSFCRPDCDNVDSYSGTGQVYGQVVACKVYNQTWLLGHDWRFRPASIARGRRQRAVLEGRMSETALWQGQIK